MDEKQNNMTDYRPLRKCISDNNNELVIFVNEFKSEHGIPLDPIYTGKIMFGVMDLIKTGAFREGARVLAIHTGGLQGIAGFNERFGSLIDTES